MSLPSKIYSSVIEPLLNIAIPPVCILCNASLDEKQSLVCASCRRELKPPPSSTATGLLHEIDMPQIKEIFIGFEYCEKLMELIHFFKYERFTSLSSIFAAAVAARIAEDIRIDLILPVPLHPWKKHERGYNQSDLIVKELSRLMGIDYRVDILKRIKYTVSQTTLNKNERMQNVSNAFVCNENVRSKAVLIVDDVITTGSTLKACAQSVLRQEAKSVYLGAVTTPPFSSN